MSLLLDTHTFLWWCADDPKLSTTARNAISQANQRVLFSVVSAWEIAIKTRLGKLTLPSPPQLFMTSMLKRHRFEVLEISLAHATAEFNLPSHHADPFDRLLIVQAQQEELTLVTNDGHIERYKIVTLW